VAGDSVIQGERIVASATRPGRDILAPPLFAQNPAGRNP
jgi:hypothetical protein